MGTSRATTGILLALGAALVVASARADSIGPPPTCQPWQSVERHHGSARCADRPCQRSAECGGGVCHTRRVCVVREEVFVSSPGPCRDMDGDGECDRTRTTREREAGACPSAGSCAEGSCQTRGTCAEH